DAGVVVDRDDCWIAYRRGTWAGLVMAVGASMLVERTERGDDMFMAMASRHALQALGRDAGELADDCAPVRPPGAAFRTPRPPPPRGPGRRPLRPAPGVSGRRARAPRPVRSTSSDPDRRAPPVAAGTRRTHRR